MARSYLGALHEVVLPLLLERLFSWDVLWCNLTAMCFSGLINFTLNEKVVFRLKKDKKTTSNL